MWKLQNSLLRLSLTIYKSFIRPHLDYGDIMYDQSHNASFQQGVESRSPKYLLKIISKLTRPYSKRNTKYIIYFKIKHGFFRITFQSVIIGWGKPGSRVRSASGLNIFKMSVLGFIGPTAGGVFGCRSLRGFEYLTTLRLWPYRVYKHKLGNTLNLLFACGCDVENICHVLLHSPETLFLTKLLILIVIF